MGYFGVGAAAGVATAAIGSAGGLAVIEASKFSGVAAGAITGGGNVAMQGGGFADIAAGAIGGGLIGGTVGFLGGAAMMGLGGIASNISAPSSIQSVISDGWCKINNINLLDVYNDLNHSAANFGSGILGGSGGLGAGNLFQFANISSSPVNLRTSTNPIGDIFQRVHYQNSVGDGLKYDYLSDIILQNGYGKSTPLGPKYHDMVNVNGAEYSLRVAVRSYNIKDQDRYQVFQAGFGYLDRFTNYPFDPRHNGGYHSFRLLYYWV